MDEPVITNSSGEAQSGNAPVVLPHDGAANDQRALAITRALFAGAATLEVECDRSYPEYQWRVITVCDNSVPAELLKREQHWHERMRSELGASAARYSLCVYPE